MVLDCCFVIDSCRFFFIRDCADVSLLFINHDQHLICVKSILTYLPLVPVSRNSSILRASEAIGWLVKAFSDFVCGFDNKLIIVFYFSKGFQELFFFRNFSRLDGLRTLWSVLFYTLVLVPIVILCRWIIVSIGSRTLWGIHILRGILILYGLITLLILHLSLSLVLSIRVLSHVRLLMIVTLICIILVHIMLHF